MLRFLAACLLLQVSTVFCQSPSAPATPPTTLTLRTEVQLVVEDVVVTDTHGNPVGGLQQGDFIVTEKGLPQVVRGFEDHTGGTVKLGKAQPLPQGVFSNVPPVDGIANILLLDGLNTPPQAQPYLRDQLVKFLAAEQPGRRTAVFALNGSLNLLQSFTADPVLLKRVVKLQGVQFSPLLQRELNDSAAHQTSETLSDMIERAPSPDMAATLAAMQRGLLDMEARRASQQVQVRARTTMDALRQLARYLSGVPGRKNLMWFSGSFPVSIQRDVQTTGDPFAGQADLSAELQRTINLLAASRVAVYPIDARGLEPPPSQMADESGFQGDLQRTRRTYGTMSANPRDSQFYLDQAAEHATMQDLAQGTGGEAFYNTNGLQQAAERAASDGSRYYTLQYTPPPGKPAELRRIDIRVNRPGLKLSYRRSYFSAAAATVTPPSTLGMAASFSAPDASEIAFQLQPITVTSAPPEKIIGLKAAGVAYKLYALNLMVPTTALAILHGDDGKWHVTLEFATLLYNANGGVADSHQDRAALLLDDARYQGMVQSGGVRFHHTVALTPGSQGSVRVLVRDVSNDRIGSLHLTNEQVRQAAQTQNRP